MSEVIRRRIINPPSVHFPVAHYSHAVQMNNSLLLSGQIGMDESGNLAVGFKAQVRQVLENIKKVLHAYGASFDNVVRTIVLLADIETIVEMDEIYSEYFKENKPARMCYQVAALPKKALIEIATDAVIGKVENI